VKIQLYHLQKVALIIAMKAEGSVECATLIANYLRLNRAKTLLLLRLVQLADGLPVNKNLTKIVLKGIPQEFIDAVDNIVSTQGTLPRYVEKVMQSNIQKHWVPMVGNNIWDSMTHRLAFIQSLDFTNTLSLTLKYSSPYFLEDVQRKPESVVYIPSTGWLMEAIQKKVKWFKHYCKADGTYVITIPPNERFVSHKLEIALLEAFNSLYFLV